MNNYKNDFSYESEKKLKDMFDNISEKYDIINNILSFGLDSFWRKNVIDILKKFYVKRNYKHLKILDLASGTGELSFLLLNEFDGSKIIGLDPSKKMIKVAKKKLKKINNNYKNNISFIKGYSQNIPFDNETFDIITISFGLRNFQFIHKSFKEMYRVIKSYGKLIILEFSKPNNIFFRNMYYLYNKLFMIKIGGFLSKNYCAYNYLNKSIYFFSFDEKRIKNIFQNENFILINTKKLTFGIASIYFLEKNIN
ncbi:bifunctional demethylmenaquinone methyltransferase/2-methoxy-6-polyprenyl-1,4-benzoquinol methylase UbiE [Blattabacterium cuenoti]|uniref:bifunctional demethylmenaquinone methyltransferase/2-methoxy-6-polyprenyl-1,4-benzoquinol methylase UbiE n=1 Tax=Blattabacterium cuenoti TaxID=1653831 RepID=UPI00163BCA6B|nr:bifunctional demethylmenaquinone methyltransferase/2-methoxy-6-polyprenyl-1,4-benzoquinol methylase UbiE [Blattabacterium cuenoti]